jgi:hypothetical protein
MSTVHHVRNGRHGSASSSSSAGDGRSAKP